MNLNIQFSGAVVHDFGNPFEGVRKKNSPGASIFEGARAGNFMEVEGRISV